MLMHRSPQASAPPVSMLGAASANDLPDERDLVEFTRIVMRHETPVARAYIDGLRARGTPLETIYLELMAPAARRLGDLWMADECDFTQVTLGLCRLQQLLREFGVAGLVDVESRERGRRVMLAPVPGEQHTFGLIMVADFFRRAGWDVWDEPAASRERLLDAVGAGWFAVIGLSAGTEARLDDMAKMIRALRRASRNRAIGVIVGGAAFVGQPERVAVVGADACAHDGRHAVEQANGLLAMLSRRV
jgi:methanogenic corrinoid protein MtbC1